VLAGGGDLECELRQRVERLGIADRVVLPGVLTQGGVAEALAASDVAVVPSVRDDSGNVDGLPNVVLEALASATPLVATTAGGIASVVKHDENGLLVAERDPSGLASAIDRLLSDRALAVRLGTTARVWATVHGGWDQVAERFEAVYERASSSKEQQARG
jgi:glycosyltransferase involved in cell wall biosynthesis